MIRVWFQPDDDCRISSRVVLLQTMTQKLSLYVASGAK